MTLSLIIPVWNDLDGMRRLLTQTVTMQVFQQIIISDDASDPPVTPHTIGLPHLADDSRLTWLRSDAQLGAGHARNLALDHVTGDHLIFFDSDDMFLPEFAHLVTDLTGLEFDFCIFRHADSRMVAKGSQSPLAPDDGEWTKAGAMTETPTLLPLKGATRLCRISAYPWNKLYRTAFVRDAGLRCTEIPVHNDLELHWVSFLKADRILTSKRVCCEHFVETGGSRLTNRTSSDRFQVFQALESVLTALDQSPRRLDYLEPFAEFFSRLFPWINDLLEPELKGEFATLVRRFLLARLSVPMFSLIVMRNPAVGARLNRALSVTA